MSDDVVVGPEDEKVLKSILAGGPDERVHSLFVALLLLADEISAVRRELKAAQWTHRGAWDPTKSYARGDCVQHSGSCWLRVADGANDRPGAGASGWVLVAKAGRDGSRGTVRVPSRGSAITDPRGGQR